MTDRYGVVKGLSTEDAYAEYVLFSQWTGWLGRADFDPDLRDEAACLARMTWDEPGRCVVLRFRWRPREAPVGPLR
jgi:hypothetical protein